MEGLLTLIAIFVVIGLISWIAENARKAGLYETLRPRLDKLNKLELAEQEFQQKQEQWGKKVEEDKQALETLAKEKSQGFPWLTQAYADYFNLQDLRVAEYLVHKRHPAKKAAEHVREIAKKRRLAERLWRVLKYQLEYYENLFPWLIDFKGEDIDDLIRQLVEKTYGLEAEIEDEDEDQAKHWLTSAEYRNLPRVDKYQLALDRYWQKKKSKWEIGRDYERYVGFQYENQGYRIYYQGIVEGLADLGRDLIAIRDTDHRVIQCKRWSREKLIHEKHVFQLLGTLIAYRIDNEKPDASGILITSTQLSIRARQFAEALRIQYVENYPPEKYPSIKCNVSRTDGTRIYHLPFDQQYDRVLVEKEKLECYVETVQEAEALGFRRAFRWRGAKSTKQT